VPVNSADDPDTVVIPVYMREVTYVVLNALCVILLVEAFTLL